jgi:hypothetical protein
LVIIGSRAGNVSQREKRERERESFLHVLRRFDDRAVRLFVFRDLYNLVVLSFDYNTKPNPTVGSDPLPSPIAFRFNGCDFTGTCNNI